MNRIKALNVGDMLVDDEPELIWKLSSSGTAASGTGYKRHWVC